VDWTIFGGSPGFGQSDVATLIRIANISPAALDFHFWQFVDFNLLGTPLDTSVPARHRCRRPARLWLPTLVEIGRPI
jgi:hypothetical protein